MSGTLDTLCTWSQLIFWFYGEGISGPDFLIICSRYTCRKWENPTVLVRVLQRNRTNRKYYEELAQAITETEKSQDLQLASWRPRSGNWYSSSPKACRLETQEGRMFQFQSEGSKRPMARLKGGREKPLLLTAGSAFVLFRPTD